MRKGARKMLSFIGAGVMSLASVFSLLFVIVKNSDLSLKNASISNEMITLGGGGANL